MALATRTDAAHAFETDLAALLRKMKGVAGDRLMDHVRVAINKALPVTFKSPEAEALFRGIEAQRRLKESEGGSLSAEEAGKILGLSSRQAVFDRYRQQRLIGWREKQGAVRFPIWQFGPDGNVLEGLPDVLKILGHQSPDDDWAKVLFFLSPRESLDHRRPLDLLRKGKVKQVKALAQAYAE